jgi:tetratricopeptide (TPR) repeat protein
MANERKQAGNIEDAPPTKPEAEMSAAEYLREARALLGKGRRGEAYQLLRPAVVKYAEDPFLLSYFGYLTALLEGRYRNGIESCKRAIVLFEKKSLSSLEDVEVRLNAVLYLNLGRAYLAGGKKKDAIDTLQKGLRFDKQNKDLVGELETLGIRKYVPVPFLDRSNLINAFLGRMLRKPDKNLTS